MVGKEWSKFFDRKVKQAGRDTKFETFPVPPKEFFDIWMKQPLYPEQLKAVEALFMNDFQDLSTEVHEEILMLGEGAGKDFLAERMLIYVGYWLNCLKSPQNYLGKVEGTPIDLANTSVSESHANDIFFKQFCEAVKLVINPSTGHNWFEEQGMDIREGRDILSSQVKFPKHITAYSLNSVRWTGEGKNILIGILDEIAEFKYDKAKSLYTNLKATANSRFPHHQKIILISYLRDEFDFMNSHYEEVDTLPEDLQKRVYRARKATWEVNLAITKDMYRDAYLKDPEDAARRYENIIPSKTSGKFIKTGEVILKSARTGDVMPIISETPYFTCNLNKEIYKPWFKPFMTKEIYDLQLQYDKELNPLLKERISHEKEKHQMGSYFMHIDLSRGLYDYAGFCLLHNYPVTEDQIGYYVDYCVQLRPEDKEIDFEEIRKFIFQLQDTGYPIVKVSLDGWNSADFLQLLDKRGIGCEMISVDRTMHPYNTLKDLLYQELISLPNNPILLRELNELQVDDQKVDHPRDSNQRLRDEGTKRGSKDLADAVAGAVFSAVNYGSGGDGSVVITPYVDTHTDIETLDKLY